MKFRVLHPKVAGLLSRDSILEISVSTLELLGCLEEKNVGQGCEGSLQSSSQLVVTTQRLRGRGGLCSQTN